MRLTNVKYVFGIYDMIAGEPYLKQKMNTNSKLKTTQ